MRSIRCSARRSRAAATISIARVILWMFLTDAMRFLTSFWVAIRRAPSCRCARRAAQRARTTGCEVPCAASAGVLTVRRSSCLGPNFLLGPLDRALGLLAFGLGFLLGLGLLSGTRRRLLLLARLDAIGFALGDRVTLLVEVGTEVVDHLGDRLAER